MRVVLPTGGVIQAHGLSGFIETSDHVDPEWALYLDDSWGREGIGWPYRMVRWPDFGLPADESDAFDALQEATLHISSGKLIDVACDGGTGRTGTALACLAVRDGVPIAEAVRWVRDHYSPYAIERVEQEELIVRFGRWAETLS